MEEQNNIAQNMNQGETPITQNVNTEIIKKSTNTTLFVIIVIIILAVIFFLGISQEKQINELDMQIMQKQEEIKNTDETVIKIEAQSESDSITDIEKDLNATNIDDLDL